MDQIAKIEDISLFHLGIIVTQLAILDNPLEIKNSFKILYPDIKLDNQTLNHIKSMYKDDIDKIRDFSIETLLSHKMAQSKLIFNECDAIIEETKNILIETFDRNGNVISSKPDFQARLKALDLLHKEKWAIKKHELEKLRIILVAKNNELESINKPINTSTGSSVSIAEWEDEN